HGSAEQKRRYLPPLLRGEKIGSFGLTQPHAGSDAGATETTVQLNGDYWVINGQKRFITNGSFADVVVFTASHDPMLKTKAISAFVVERGTPGFSVGRKEDKLGLRASDTAELHFDDCRLPRSHLLGKEREGFKVFMETLDGGRISIAVLGLGIAIGALAYATSYVTSRQRGGTPIYRNQWVQEVIAEAATEIECARHLIYHAAALKDQGARVTAQSAMAKLYASEVGTRTCRRLMDVIGPEALLSSNPLQRLLRDAKLMEIGEGTSQIQKLIIAREILGR
ncbi:MAG: acyl-CoA dehydrogenase family protein, partial [Calditrichaeota bacterium]|nr:acyl-CoA dehydrogenase family protein [Calditrichota bacterium]